MTFICHGVVSGAFRGEGKGRPELRNGPLWRIFHNLMMLFFIPDHHPHSDGYIELSQLLDTEKDLRLTRKTLNVRATDGVPK